MRRSSGRALALPTGLLRPRSTRIHIFTSQSSQRPSSSRRMISDSSIPPAKDQNTMLWDALIQDITETEDRDAIYLRTSTQHDTKPEDQDAAYWTALKQEIEDTRKRLNDEMALWSPKRKEYHRIEESLDNNSIKSGAPWGFVVYRTVYSPSSDALWTRMLGLLRSTVAESLTLDNQPELLPHHELSVVEDEATLSGADSHTVRGMFRAWVADDLIPRLDDAEVERCGGVAQIRSKLASNDAHHDGNHPVACLPSRWKYCLFVDEDCLRSLDPANASEPVIKLLTTEWTDDRPGAPTEVWTENWDGGETDHEFEDVGWRYADVIDYVLTYQVLINPYGWEERYERPVKGYVR
jgi:hypothetical protein